MAATISAPDLPSSACFFHVASGGAAGGGAAPGFAIPIDQVKAIVPELRDKGKFVRGWLGAASAEEDKATIGARVGRVLGLRRQALRPESLPRRGNPRHEAAARPHPTAKDDPPLRHDEHTIGRRAALIDCEARRPGRSCRVRTEGLTFQRGEPHRSTCQRLAHDPSSLRTTVLQVAMSGPLLTGRRFHPVLQEL